MIPYPSHATSQQHREKKRKLLASYFVFFASPGCKLFCANDPLFLLLLKKKGNYFALIILKITAISSKTITWLILLLENSFN